MYDNFAKVHDYYLHSTSYASQYYTVYQVRFLEI